MIASVLAAVVVLGGAPAEAGEAVRVADAFWGRLGVASQCSTVTVRAVDASLWDTGTSMAVAAAPWEDACTIGLDRRYVLAWRWASTEGRLARRRALLGLCKVIIHEDGHVRGRGHDDGGIMSASVDAVRAPGGCFDWAVAKTPRPSPRRRAAWARTLTGLARERQP